MFHIARHNLDQLVQMETVEVERKILRFSPPSARAMSLLTAPYRALMAPVFLGLENIPDPAKCASPCDYHMLKQLIFESPHSRLLPYRSTVQVLQRIL